jgi:hypothetical protein
MNEKSQRRPIIDPVILALKSRRVIIAISALMTGIITLAVPELNAVRIELLTLILTLALVVIGGYSIEDAARAAHQQEQPPGAVDHADLERLIRELVTAVIDEMLPPTD